LTETNSRTIEGEEQLADDSRAEETFADG
jgi:hypothetical protein